MDNLERLWRSERTRAEYLAEQAVEETLIHALDLDGFRAYMHMSKRLFPNEQTLSILHHRRARSKHIPAAAREESARWVKGGEATELG